MGTETPPAQLTGPTLAIVGSCGGCPHLRPSTVGGHRLGFVDCAHPLKPVPFIGNVNTSITTPADCPEQGPARIALGRALVGEAEPEADRHLAILSGHPGIGQIGCMSNPTAEAVEHEKRCNPGCIIEASDRATCPVCQEPNR